MQRKAQEETAAPVVADSVALRCHCGSLLARLVPQGVEIKCRRCKRRIVIRLDDGDFG